MTAYLSQETHLSLTKAFRVLGLSDSHVRRVSIDGERRMNAKALADWIDDDRAAGLHPVCVCASSGTANTGAIDPLSDIADVCEERGLWMHVDGAYGAPIAMLEEFEWVSRALKRASSVSLDPHKWLFAPIDVGCVMFRSPDETRSTFSEDAAYTRVEQDKKNESFAFFDHGLELTRRARALKVWAILRTRGRRQLESIIRQNIALRQHLDERIAKEAHLQRLGSGLSISCFRWWESSLEEKQLNAINQDIINTLNNEGECFMSPTVLEGRLALRVCIVNFRTRREDIDWLIERILKIATP